MLTRSVDPSDETLLHTATELPLRRGGSILPVAGAPAAIVGLLLASMAIRFCALALLPLAPEEAYYWMYAQHLSAGYFDHPPMIAWAIRLGTSIFGDTEFGVRIIPHLLMLAASALTYVYGKAWFGRRAGAIGALGLHVLPVFFATGFIAIMDSALLFFWSACMVGVTIALRRGRAWGWYLAGASLGLALLTKYSAIFLAAGAVAAVLVHRPWRGQLASIHPYLAVLLGAAIFSPTVAWNARHGWASFRFQFVDRYEGGSLSPVCILTFVGFQIAVLTPVLALGLWALSRRLLRRPAIGAGGARRRARMLAPRWLLAFAFSCPLLSVLAYKSLRYHVHVNWTLPAYLSLLPAIAQYFLARLRLLKTAPQRGGWTRLLTRTALACATINFASLAYLLAVEPKAHLVPAFSPWPVIARIVEDHACQLRREGGREPLVVAEGSYRLASTLAFYRRPLVPAGVDAIVHTSCQWIFGGADPGLAFAYWTTPEQWRGCDVLYVVQVTNRRDSEKNVLAELRQRFDSVAFVDDPRLERIGAWKYRLAICRNFQPAEPRVRN